MKRFATLTILGLGILLTGCTTRPAAKEQRTVWRGVHLFVQSEKAAEDLTQNLPRLAEMGVNVVIVEINYSFDFKSHPELRSKHFVSRPQIRKLVAAAKRAKIELIPELDCLGHQGSHENALPMLRVHPEFTEPPSTTIETNLSHMKSWCPNDPVINPIAFDLIDEIARAFKAKAFHVGMDEVMNIASDNCPRCRGHDPAKDFAKVVKEFHHHLVDEKHLQMLMWGDRLLDDKAMKYGKWEGSSVGTWPAIDLIPKDIIICDWHYELRESYPSVPLFLENGFRVWPSGWQPLEATKKFSAFSMMERKQNTNLIGYLCTAWGRANARTIVDWPPTVEVLKDWKD